MRSVRRRAATSKPVIGKTRNCEWPCNERGSVVNGNCSGRANSLGHTGVSPRLNEEGRTHKRVWRSRKIHRDWCRRNSERIGGRGTGLIAVVAAIGGYKRVHAAQQIWYKIPCVPKVVQIVDPRPTTACVNQSAIVGQCNCP